MYSQNRNTRRRTTWLVWLIPMVLICCLGVFLLAPAVPGVILRFIGFTPRGSVETFWEEQAAQMTPISIVGNLPAAPPTVVGSPASVPGSTPTPVIVAGATATPPSSSPPAGAGGGDYFGWFQSASVPQTLSITSTTGSVSASLAEAYVADARFGTGVDGFPLGVIRYQENAIDGICATWLRGCATDQFRLSAVDFRPGGMIVYGSVTAGGLAQSLGLVLTIGPDGKSLMAQGIVLGGQLYAVPQSGDIASYVAEAISRSNQALGQLQVQAAGMNLGLVQMQFMDEALTLIFR